VPERIEFKLAVLVFRCLHGTAPAYLADELYDVSLTATLEGGCAQHTRLRWWFRQPVERQSAIVPFLLLHHLQASLENIPLYEVYVLTRDITVAVASLC